MPKSNILSLPLFVLGLFSLLLLSSSLVLLPVSGWNYHAQSVLSQENNPQSFSEVRTLCNLSSVNGNPSGMYPAKGGGAFVEDWDTGNIYYCNNGSEKIVIHSPVQDTGFYGLTGVVLAGSLDLIASSFNAEGFYICKGVTTNGADSCTSLIPYSSSYCSSTFAKECIPDGIATDKNLNLYFVDVLNANLAICYAKSDYQRCRALESFGSTYPDGLTIFHGNIYVTDSGCQGYVFENGKVIAHTHESLSGIVLSSDNPQHVPHILLGYSGECHKTAGGIFDLTSDKLLPTGLKTSDDIIGVTPELQFDAYYNGGVFRTSDS